MLPESEVSVLNRALGKAPKWMLECVFSNHNVIPLISWEDDEDAAVNDAMRQLINQNVDPRFIANVLVSEFFSPEEVNSDGSDSEGQED